MILTNFLLAILMVFFQGNPTCLFKSDHIKIYTESIDSSVYLTFYKCDYDLATTMKVIKLNPESRGVRIDLEKRQRLFLPTDPENTALITMWNITGDTMMCMTFNIHCIIYDGPFDDLEVDGVKVFKNGK